MTAAGRTRQAPGQVEMTNSLVAQNQAASGPDLPGVLISDFNVVPPHNTPGPDLIGQGAASLCIDPQLHEQRGPAGPVWVLALLPGSSAIDRIPRASCYPGRITTDRPAGRHASSGRCMR